MENKMKANLPKVEQDKLENLRNRRPLRNWKAIA